MAPLLKCTLFAVAAAATLGLASAQEQGQLIEEIIVPEEAFTNPEQVIEQQQNQPEVPAPASAPSETTDTAASPSPSVDPFAAFDMNPDRKPWLKRMRTNQNCISKTYDFKDNKMPEEFKFAGGAENAEIKDGKLRIYLKPSTQKWGTAVTILNAEEFMLFGSVDAVVRVEKVPGTVIALVLRAEGQVDGRDEIDYEWVGKDDKTVQTNVFANGHVIYAKYGREHQLEGGKQARHNYSLTWDPDKINFNIDNQLVRTHEAASSYDTSVSDYIFPVVPMRFEFGIWDASATGNQGTVDWAGGPVDWSKWDTSKPLMEIESITIRCMNESARAPTKEKSKTDNSTSTFPRSSGADKSGMAWMSGALTAGAALLGGLAAALI